MGRTPQHPDRQPGPATATADASAASGSRRSWFIARQVALVAGAVVAYFGVRGMTEGSAEAAREHAARLYDLERSLGLAIETRIQDAAAWSDALVTPGFVNAYAAVPSLHFGWNLLVGQMWVRIGQSRWWTIAGAVMPAAMAWAVMVTGNHWLFDVISGGLVALTGLMVERFLLRRPRRFARDEREASADHRLATYRSADQRSG